MGLSSSQARLLNLTGRMHQIEYKAAKLEAQKLQMANESRQVFNEYQQALEKTKVQLKTMNSDGSTGFIDATYNTLIEAGYKIEFIGDTAPSTSAKLLKPITQIINPADIPDGYIAINSVEDLQDINNNLSGNYILMADIDLSGINWEPIGDDYSDGFSGTLNGNGHVIKNLTVNTSGYAGLFDHLVEASISNLGIENANVTSTTSVAGILAASDYGFQGKTFSNCYVTGNVCGKEGAGGFFGYVDHGQEGAMINCYVDANVSTTNGTYCGTFWGCDYDATDNVTDSYFVENSSIITNHDAESDGVQIISRTDFEAMFTQSSSGNESDFDYKNSTEWLTNMLNAGAIILSKPDGKGNFFDTSVATDTGLQEVADESGLRKAEAKYEADMRRIDMKDRKYDYDLAALDNERNAIKNEMETLKTVAKDNVDRTFKLFG